MPRAHLPLKHCLCKRGYYLTPKIRIAKAPDCMNNRRIRANYWHGILIASFLAILGFPIFLSGCDSKKRDPNVLRIGADLTFPPFEMQDDSGNPSGVGVELALALAEHLGKRAEIVPVSFDSLIGQLEEGEIDLIISSMTITEERSKRISFSDPYANTGLATLVPIDSSLTRPEDLKKPGLRIVVRSGTTAATFCPKAYPKAIITKKTEDFECVLALTEGHVDAYVFDQLAVWQHHQNNSRTTRVILDLLNHESWGIGIRQEDDELRAQTNAFLKKFRGSGDLKRLGEKFLDAENKMLHELGQPGILD